MEVRVYATLRDVLGAKSVILPVPDEPTIQDILQALLERYPAARPKLLDANGQLYGAVHILINGRDGHYLDDGLNTRVRLTDTVDIFPAVGGG